MWAGSVLASGGCVLGQSQLLLILVSVLMVGTAIVVGFMMYEDSAAEANLANVTGDLLNLAGRAMRYYANPDALGGGSRSFVGLTANAAGLALSGGAEGRVGG